MSKTVKPSSQQASFEFAAHGQVIRMHWSNGDDHIPRQIVGHRNFYESEMLEDVGRRVPEGALVVDVGANIGNHTVFFARVLGNPTLAVEPNPAALRQLRRNIDLNEVSDRVDVYALALGAGAGRGRIVDEDPANLGRAQVAAQEDGEVQIISLDELLGERDVGLIKVDVEGMEVPVLEGARATLARCKPWLLVEAATAEALAGVEAVLRPLGYRKQKVYNATPTYLFAHVRADAGPMVERLPEADLARLPRTTQIVAGMATVAGNEEAMRATVMSLLPQVDRLYVYLNHFKAVPDFLARHPKVSCFVDEDGRRYGDAGKFWGLAQSPEAVYFTCDDDIVYAPDFVASMVRELAALEGQAILGVHGSLILQPTPSYYDMAYRSVFHFERSLMRRRRVHVPATNASAFHSSVVPMSLADFEAPNMADIWLARFALRRQLPSYVVPRPANWLEPLEVKRPTIYQQSVSKSGSAYDSSRKQDEVLKTLYPVSLLESPQGVGAHFVLVHAAEAVPDLIRIVGHKDSDKRDRAIFLLPLADAEAVRRAALQSGFQREIHVLDVADRAKAAAYARLLRQAGEVECLELGPKGLSLLSPDAWTAHLPRA